MDMTKVTKEDIKNLADLSRIEISEDETEKMTSEVDSILNYVGIIQNVGGDAKSEVSRLRNVMREDEPINKSGKYTETILKNAPQREGNYLKVKKILG